MLKKADLAEAINKAIDARDEEGNPIKTTPEMEIYADAIITTLTTSTFSHLLVEGTTAAGSPLQLGKAENGLFTPPLVPAPWLAVLSVGFPTANPAALSLDAVASTAYLSGAAQINFEAGKIKGQCTSTSNSPGPLVAGQGLQGKIVNIEGGAWAASTSPPTGNPALAKKIYDAITKYLIDNAEAEYLPQTVSGTCPTGGGPLAAGIGAGGIIK